uniref:Uncharacterized protein n=1 Tax=Physcomitrium patens TaxID=3218 RepID=A0A2K1IGN0_PHYPA|nr:hypothetical protein PHYPA_029024 [Physcomitrium patens]
MASPNYTKRQRSHPESRHQSSPAVVALVIVSASLLLPLTHAQLLHPVNMLALRSTKATMNNLPGGSFSPHGSLHYKSTLPVIRWVAVRQGRQLQPRLLAVTWPTYRRLTGHQRLLSSLPR